MNIRPHDFGGKHGKVLLPPQAQPAKLPVHHSSFVLPDTSSVLTHLQAAPAAAIPAPLPADSPQAAAAATPQAEEDPLITLIRQTPTITRARLAEHLGVSGRTIDRRIRALKEQGLIIRIGSDKDGEWQLK